MPSLQEVAETFVCAPIKRPERQWPLPKDRHCPQTFLFGQSGIRRCCPWRHHPLILSMTEAELPERNARQDIHRQAAERLALMGRAVSVSQSLSGLRSSQSPPHGCCQRSGYAAGVPTRPATSVLGGFATLSAPAFPSSCAAATAAAAAVRGSEIIIIVLLLETKHISCANLSYTTVVLLVFLLYLRKRVTENGHPLFLCNSDMDPES